MGALARWTTSVDMDHHEGALPVVNRTRRNTVNSWGMSHTDSGKLLFGLPHTTSWVRAASAAPVPVTAVAAPPRLSVTTWPDGDDPLIVANLRPEQMAALSPGFARWTGDHVETPWHRRGVIERSPGGAALCVAGVLVASGTVLVPTPGWAYAETCTVGLLCLADHCGGALAEDFAEAFDAGLGMVAEMAVVDLTSAAMK